MKIIDALRRVRIIRCPDPSPPVVETAVGELRGKLKQPAVETKGTGSLALEPGVLLIAVLDDALSAELEQSTYRIDQENFILVRIEEDGSGLILSSKPEFLFSFICYLLEHLATGDLESVRQGYICVPTFAWRRVSYDFFLTQEGRIQKNFRKKSYIRELARLGFTHVEVNGLAYPMALESGPPGETYHMFYTYCPALDQFVCSSLNRGIYPHYYLSANMDNLKENARIALTYGLTPGLLCFEPRSVPEEFFARYPMLRGARVDHPFRSFKPRYNMTIAHPLVREHYATMLKKIMREVPELGYICIWTNDSGAGFEHTRSLYVGRNGGAYLIREWKDDEEIARLAGENALRFFRLLRDAGREINPDFRVITRLESFSGEHDIIWNGLSDSIEVETSSLLGRGWDIPYTHPRYPEKKAPGGGTIYQETIHRKERTLMKVLRDRDSRAHFYFAAGPHAMFEPLLGIPYPFLTHRRLKTLRASGVDLLAHNGGICPPELVPFDVNHEVVRLFQFDPEIDIEEVVENIARGWAGEETYKILISAWKLIEEAILAFPNVTPLYSTFGFTWYRLWLRPLVPDIDAIPPGERAYYENYMCTTPHNPNNVDLSRDVLFRLTTPRECVKDVERIDKHLWKPLDWAIELLRGDPETDRESPGEKPHPDGRKAAVMLDQLVRFRALRCWFMTQRNVAAWIVRVHGYMNAGNDEEKNWHRTLLKDMMEKEIENTRQLRELLRTGVVFIPTAGSGETPLVHGRNIATLLKRRIILMERHFDDEPRIDPEYMMKRSVELIR